MQVVHTSYIKRLADKTGKTYRELETLWKKMEREVDNERMFDPNKFSHLRSRDGSIAQEIARRFEKQVIDPMDAQSDKIEDAVAAEENEEFAQDIENSMEADLDAEANEVESDLGDELDMEEEPMGDIDFSDAEINLDDFEDLEPIKETAPADESEEPDTETESENEKETEEPA